MREAVKGENAGLLRKSRSNRRQEELQVRQRSCGVDELLRACSGASPAGSDPQGLAAGFRTAVKLKMEAKLLRRDLTIDDTRGS